MHKYPDNGNAIIFPIQAIYKIKLTYFKLFYLRQKNPFQTTRCGRSNNFGSFFSRSPVNYIDIKLITSIDFSDKISSFIPKILAIAGQ